jgi:hypothetical protein
MIGKRTILAGLLLSLGLTAFANGNDARLRPVNRGMLCVTEGSLDDSPGQRFTVDVPKMRAYVNRYTTQEIEVRFTYLGPTENESPLASGEMRRQFGLKLRSQDPCNLVYAMWRIEPKSEIVVSVKTNPGQHTSSECTNHGYRNIKPALKKPIPELRLGDTHSLGAEMTGDRLRVSLDDSVVWDGDLGPDALNLNGPVGIRSDNAHLELQLLAGEPSGAHPDFVIACKSGPDQSE